eukprot:COSAG02_NODE_8077_length_2720_cov_1.261732_3_plen_219_part_00
MFWRRGEQEALASHAQSKKGECKQALKRQRQREQQQQKKQKQKQQKKQQKTEQPRGAKPKEFTCPGCGKSLRSKAGLESHAASKPSCRQALAAKGRKMQDSKGKAEVIELLDDTDDDEEANNDVAATAAVDGGGVDVNVIELLSSSSSSSSSGSEADEDDGVVVGGSSVSASSSRNGTRRPNTDGPVGRGKQHARWRGKRGGKAANKYQQRSSPGPPR